mmetsp:Transcript_5240/g.13342  ORF Transcript_5240/g.13342 Transcript_5240/m.13342 type:complete len:250 (-) Transcript_5240:998-1747(-)
MMLTKPSSSSSPSRSRTNPMPMRTSRISQPITGLSSISIASRRRGGRSPPAKLKMNRSLQETQWVTRYSSPRSTTESTQPRKHSAQLMIRLMLGSDQSSALRACSSALAMKRVSFCTRSMMALPSRALPTTVCGSSSRLLVSWCQTLTLCLRRPSCASYSPPMTAQPAERRGICQNWRYSMTCIAMQRKATERGGYSQDLTFARRRKTAGGVVRASLMRTTFHLILLTSITSSFSPPSSGLVLGRCPTG